MKMPKIIKVKSLLVGLITLMCFAFGVQALTPTAEQIEQFKRLSPAEQQQLAKQFGITLPQATGTTPIPTIVDVPVVQPRAVEADNKAVNPKVDAIEENAAKAADDVVIADPVQKKVIREEIKQFGYDLFAGAPSTFAPATDIPVPSEYVMGPGDTIVMQLFGKDNETHQLTVDREGQIAFPGVGPVAVAGLSFSELKDYLTQMIDEKMIGVKGSITLGSLRSIRIFVLGEAYQPGSYTVSALSTMTNALFVSGGVTKIGSLRNIELKRKGKVVATMDLYDLLLKGDSSSDTRLLPGDVLFIPAVGKTVGVSGEVRRPAIYELKDEKTAGDIVTLAGGLLPTAYPKASRIERIDEQRKRSLVDIDLSADSGKKQTVRDGDVIQVFSVLDRMENIVIVSGQVRRPGAVEWQKGLRIKDVIQSLDELLPDADLNYALVKRENKESRKIEVLAVNLANAFTQTDGHDNIVLQARDEIIIFSLAGGRQAAVDEIVQQLSAQARFQEPPKVVTIVGNVRFPGSYPLSEGMTVRNLIGASLDFKEYTDLRYAVISRKNHSDSLHEVIALDLTNESSMALGLNPEDKLYVFSLKQSRTEQINDLILQLQTQANKTVEDLTTTITGDVRFPGSYPLATSMRLSDLVSAAGGFQESAYLLEAEITRFETDFAERAQIKRFTVDLQSMKTGDPQGDIALHPRDKILIKRIPDWREQEYVTLSGEIRFPGVYAVERGETLREVLVRAGGLTDRAFVKAAIFTRKKLREIEEVRLKQMSDELAQNIAKTTLAGDSEKKDDSTNLDEVNQAQALLAKLDRTKAQGRLVINLEQIISDPTSQGVELDDGDTLHVPGRIDSVTVIGEVQFPNSQLYDPSSSIDQYIEHSGGTSKNADLDRIFVVKANGSVGMPKSSNWFAGSSAKSIEPGDTIVVPLEIDKLNQLALWTNVSQIFYQVALGAAAVGSF